jgi:hypothetical protein
MNKEGLDKSYCHQADHEDSMGDVERERLLKEMEEGFDFDLGEDDDDVYCD